MTIAEPAPRLSAREAATLARDLWGLEVTRARDLGSHQDRNVVLDAASGRFVLKVANRAVPGEALDAQDTAMLALAGLDVRLPRPVAALSGRYRELVEVAGHRHSVRLLTWVEGTPLSGRDHLSATTARQVGSLAGRVCAALARFDHPGAHHPGQWDLRRSAEVVSALVGALPAAQSQQVVALSAAAAAAIAPLADELPEQVIHADITDLNVVADPGPDARPVPRGLIDFGDLMSSWRAGEVAVTICALLVKDRRAPLRIAADVLAGFVAEQPLSDAEVAAVWPLVAARACAGIVSTAAQLAHEPDNSYLHDSLALDTAALELVAAVPLELGTLVMQRAAGVDPAPAAALRATDPIVRGAAALPVVDLSTTSPLLDDGAWSDAAEVRSRLRSVARGRGALIRYGEAHLHRSVANSLVEPSTVHLGIDLLVASGTEVQAPWAGRVHHVGPGSLRLEGPDGWDLLLIGAQPLMSSGRRVAAGATLATVADTPDPFLPDHVHVQVVRTGVQAPTHCPASLADAWRRLCPDPGPLLGVDAATSPPDAADLMRRRDAALAAVQQHYFAAPPQLERGWRHHLVDVAGRVYLDAINNVAVLGHSHPAVADAVARQLRTLNTNSRFHYEEHVRFAEMLKATLPPELDTVLLVATGSESVDLALRLARVHTGARDTIALRTAYHGWTTASDEVSSALMDNPRALTTRPPWVHLAEPPNPYRGRFRGPDAGTRYADDVRRILAGIAAAGRRPAAFICETPNGNAGGIELPHDYLGQVYAEVRAAGGVVIADEVQVGYGRLGSSFWGFQMHDVVPDIVCLAKATGNGFPVAAVVCRRAIAESFAVEGSLFSSMGGTPAGAAAAVATLTAIRDEDLMGNAARMGARLRGGLEGLVARHPMAGAVHGRGLYLGLEIVTDPESRTPATEATDALCERLLELGVIMAATGDDMNVLKIKPPLCIDADGVDFLLAALEVAFAEGW